MSDKYRWHDLRKNPDDLPEMEDVETTVSVLLIVNYKCTYGFHYSNYEIGYYHYYFKHWFNDDGIEMSGEVYGWKYIEPFDELDSYV